MEPPLYKSLWVSCYYTVETITCSNKHINTNLWFYILTNRIWEFSSAEVNNVLYINVRLSDKQKKLYEEYLKQCATEYDFNWTRTVRSDVEDSWTTWNSQQENVASASSGSILSHDRSLLWYIYKGCKLYISYILDVLQLHKW